MHVSQYLTLTEIPFTITSLVRGNCKAGVCLPPVSFDTEVNSSSGGCKLRGTIPGSRADVSKSSTIT